MDGNEHLRDIAIAIGALDANRRADIGHNLHHPSPRVVAFTNYQRALTRLQDKLSLKDAPQRDDVLWTTFLLGLFEVHYPILDMTVQLLTCCTVNVRTDRGQMGETHAIWYRKNATASRYAPLPFSSQKHVV